MVTMNSTRIYPNVRLGEGVIVQDWVVIGLPPNHTEPGELETVIEAGSVIRSHTVIYAGARIGPNFQTGHRAIIGPGVEIGAGCSVGTNSVVEGFVRLHDGAKVHSRCSIGMFSELREKAWVGPVCTLEGSPQRPVVVESGAMLGSTICVSAGVRVGENALVAAGAYLQRDVPPCHLVAGSPGRSVKDVTRLSCPYELIDRPYEIEQDQREIIEKRDRARLKSTEAADTWRHHLWERLGSPKRAFSQL